MNISHKLVVPSLQSACLQFLLTHAAGKPIKAMRIAELFEHDELYRESSRFVLDNPGKPQSKNPGLIQLNHNLCANRWMVSLPNSYLSIFPDDPNICCRSESELSTLSQETLLKLEKRRNWFLERVLKLGLVPIGRDYQCVRLNHESVKCLPC